MPYVYTAIGGFAAGILVAAFYLADAKAYGEAELQKAKDEIVRLKGQLRSKL